MGDTYNKDIKKNRFVNFSITVGPEYINKSGSLKLKKHRFLFGCNGFGFLDGKLEKESQQIYKEKFLDLFNSATLPFYWGGYEGVEGKTLEESMKNAGKWAVENGITLKGHPLCWHTVCADWLLQYDTPTIYKKQMDRITREVNNFSGLIDMWDVINEVVIMPKFDRYDNAVSRLAKEYGAEELTLNCFKQAKAANPGAKLLLNDFNHSPKYEALIERLLDKGCPIDAIGIQTHQHQGYHGTEYIDTVLKRFSRFGLPLHFTEMTILSGDLAPSHYDDLNDAAREEWPSTSEGEALQSKQISEIYSQLYSHPLVESIVWWDMQDGNWLNAPSGLLRRDNSTKPGYNTLKNLIHKEWGFSEQNIFVNNKGIINIHGPEGLYSLMINGKEFQFNLDKINKNINLK